MDSISSNFTIDDLVLDQQALNEALRKSFSRDPFDHYVSGIFGVFFCILGCISNALSFSVLIRRTMRLSTYVYLAGLCLSDFAACFFVLPNYILHAYPLDKLDFELPRTYTYTQVAIITGAIGTTARAVSVWLSVAFTIDRWIMICRPFVGPLYCTIKNARCVTLIIYIIGIFYAIPLMYEYEPHQDKTVFDILHVDIDNKNIYRSKLTDLGKNSIFRWTYVLVNALTVCFIPLIIIGILNRKLFKSIRLLEQRSAEYNAPLPTKQGVTVMLLATTIMLLVFRSPATAIYIMWIIRAKMFINEKPPYRLRKFHSISNLCAIINAATTFIIFVIYGTKFRSEFTRVYCGIFTKFKRTKTESTIRQDQQQQQMKHFLSDHPEKIKQSPNGREVKKNLSLTDPSNGHCCVELLKDNSSATTSIRTTSRNPMKTLLKQRHERYSFDEEHDLMIKHKNKTRQHQISIKEDESSDNQNTPKSNSYFNWFKNWFTCRHSS